LTRVEPGLVRWTLRFLKRFHGFDVLKLETGLAS
jgi:hypothetical protein